MPTQDEPAISVAMGVYYRKESLEPLRRSIESILNQTFTDFELLICDDGSSAEAWALLDKYCRQDGRIRLLRPGDRFDLASKLNVCLREAKGKYVARMDDDDASHSERLERQYAFLERETRLAFVGCCVNLWRNGEMVGERELPERPQVKDFYFSQPFVHPALMFRREALTAVGGYREEDYCRLCEDYDLLLRLYAKGFRGANIPERLFDYTLPPRGKKNRTMRDRAGEAKTRFLRFRELGVLKSAWPYVLKPIAVGLLPARLLDRIKGI